MALIAGTVLRRFEVRTLGHNIAAPAPHPLVRVSATVSLHKQGATVELGKHFQPGDTGNVTTWYPGALTRDCYVQVDREAGKFFKVLDVQDAGTGGWVISMKNETAIEISVAKGARLVVRDLSGPIGSPSPNIPAVYTDPTGSGTPLPTNAIVTDTTTGLGAYYLREKRFDYLVSGDNVNPYVGVDNDGSFVCWLR